MLCLGTTLVYVWYSLSSCSLKYWVVIYQCKQLSTLITGSVRHIPVCTIDTVLIWGVLECRPAGCSKLVPSCLRLSAETTHIQWQPKESWSVMMCCCDQSIDLFENLQVIPSAWQTIVSTIYLLVVNIGL